MTKTVQLHQLIDLPRLSTLTMGLQMLARERRALLYQLPCNQTTRMQTLYSTPFATKSTPKRLRRLPHHLHCLILSIGPTHQGFVAPTLPLWTVCVLEVHHCHYHPSSQLELRTAQLGDNSSKCLSNLLMKHFPSHPLTSQVP